MKHIINVLKNEIFNNHNAINGLVKKVTVSQEAYLKDRSNEALFNNWSEMENPQDPIQGEIDATPCRAGGGGIEKGSFQDQRAEPGFSRP